MGCKLKDIKGVHAPTQVLEGNDLVGLLYEDCGGELFSNQIPSFCARLAVEYEQALQDFLSIAVNRMSFMCYLNIITLTCSCTFVGRNTLQRCCYWCIAARYNVLGN
jgi:hypothetical protein